MPAVNQDTAAPTRKVAAATLGSAAAGVLFGLADWLGASDPPALLVAGVTTLVTFAAGYLVKETS